MSAKNNKLTKTQQEVMDKATRMYEEAQADFETWFMTSDWTNTYGPEYATFEEAVNNMYMWLAKRDRPNDVEGYIKDKLDSCREDYEMFRSGVVLIHASSNTLRALEKKGCIEIIVDGGRSTDTVRLLTI